MVNGNVMTERQFKAILPASLAPGDVIGLITPASPFNEADFFRGIQVLKDMGFQTVFDPRMFDRSGYLAGVDVLRAAQVNDAFANDDIRAIVCARGGYGAMRVLPYLDYESIHRHPKLFMGFSDITALLCVLYQRSGLVCLHGPVATTLRNAGADTRMSVFKALTSSEPVGISLKNGVTMHHGKAFGPLVCGNLTTLCHLAGTPFQPVLEDHILILEDRGEKPYRIDRMLTQMKLTGMFHGLKGLGIGDFDACGDRIKVMDVFRDIFQPMDIPILAGFDIGHGQENTVVPVGLNVLLDADRHVMSWHPHRNVM